MVLSIRPDDVIALAEQLRGIADRTVAPRELAAVGPGVPSTFAASDALHAGIDSAVGQVTNYLGSARDGLLFNSEFMRGSSSAFAGEDNDTWTQILAIADHVAGSVPRRGN